MLGLLAIRAQADKKKQDQMRVCASTHAAWTKAAELGALAAEQISEAMGDMESALKIKDPRAATDFEEMAAKHAAFGMSASEYASLIQSEMEKIANTGGCKLGVRP